MCRSDDARLQVREQHWRAVRGEHADDEAGRGRHNRIRLGSGIRGDGGIDRHRIPAVDLIERRDIGMGPPEVARDPGAVLRDIGRQVR